MQNEIAIKEEIEARNHNVGIWAEEDPLKGLRRRSQILDAVHREILTEGIDYGITPGTKQPSLYKPGAEKICSVFGLVADTSGQSIQISDLGNAHREYSVSIRFFLRGTNTLLGVGHGSCNTRENKYLYRNAHPICPHCGSELRLSKDQNSYYCWRKTGGCGFTVSESDPVITEQPRGRIENDNPANAYNTCLKMGIKRALVEGTLRISGASGRFTQDMEDLSREDNQSSHREKTVNYREDEIVPKSQSNPPAQKLSPLDKLRLRLKGSITAAPMDIDAATEKWEGWHSKGLISGDEYTKGLEEIEGEYTRRKGEKIGIFGDDGRIRGENA